MTTLEPLLEIAYNNTAICPNPQSVALLKDKTQKGLSGSAPETFTIVKVPQRVVDILNNLPSSAFSGVFHIKGETARIVKDAMDKAGYKPVQTTQQNIDDKRLDLAA